MSKQMRREDGRSFDSETVPGDLGFSRRSVLRAVGGTAGVAAGVGTLSGGASASDCGTGGELSVVFCGCTQVCWCIPFCSVPVVHTEEESFAFTDGNVDLEPKGGPYDDIEAWENCFEMGDDLEVELDGEKVVALEVVNTDGDGDGADSWKGITLFLNPHTCAQGTSEEVEERVGARLEDNGRADLLDDITVTYGDRASEVPGGCGKPPCQFEGGNGRQRKDK